MDLAKLISRRRWILYYSNNSNLHFYWADDIQMWVSIPTTKMNITNAQQHGTTDLVHWPAFTEEDAAVVIFEIMEGKQDSHTIRFISIEDYKKGGY